MNTTSKAFRAVLPALRGDEVLRLRQWSDANCAESVVFESDGAVIWLAAKDRARSREAFMRSAHNTLERLAIGTKPRGRWLVLADEGTVRSEAARRTPAAAQPLERSFAACAVEEEPGDDDRVVVLGGIGHAPPQRAVSVAALRAGTEEAKFVRPPCAHDEGDVKVVQLPRVYGETGKIHTRDGAGRPEARKRAIEVIKEP